MGLTYTSGGSALADFGMQMFYNGWDISKLNRTSVVAALLFKSPLTGAMVGSFFEYSGEKGWDNSLLGKKSFDRFLLESVVNGAGNRFGDHLGNKAVKINGDQSSLFLFKSSFFGNSGANFMSNGFSKIGDNYQSDQK